MINKRTSGWRLTWQFCFSLIRATSLRMVCLLNVKILFQTIKLNKIKRSIFLPQKPFSSNSVAMAITNLFLFLSDEGPILETLDHTIRIGSTPTFLYFDLYLYSAYAAHYVYSYSILFIFIKLLKAYSRHGNCFKKLNLILQAFVHCCK